jgi:flagellar hook protein FlgE
VAGYGLLRFDADGSLNQDLSEVFQSPQDPETFDRDGGTLSGGDKGVVSIGYKGIYIDPPDTPYPYDKSGAPPAEYGASASKIVVDFSSVTQFSGTTDVHVGTQDGHKKGTLATIEITPSGIIVGKYDNGRERDLFQIALASFNNPRGLERADKTFFRETSNSGQAMIGVPQQGPRGSVMSRFLELSNVDLTEEFTKMIIAERSFQANIRTVTTADRFMMELLRIRA